MKNIELNNSALKEKIQDKIKKYESEIAKCHFASDCMIIEEYEINKLKYIKAEVEEIIKQHKINELYEEDELLINELEEHDSNFKSIDNNLKKIKNYIDILEKILEE